MFGSDIREPVMHADIDKSGGYYAAYRPGPISACSMDFRDEAGMRIDEDDDHRPRTPD